MAASPADVNAFIDQVVFPNTRRAVSPNGLNQALHMIVALVTSGGSGPAVAAVLQALEQIIPGGVGTLAQAIPPDPSNLINIHFYHVQNMTTNGVLYSFIPTVFPGIDMGALVAAAYKIQV